MTEKQPETGRQKLEQAVTRVGRAYEDLVRTVERNGKAITSDDLQKVFTFLIEVHQGSHNKAALSLATAIAATGGFSLDSYNPSTLTYQQAAPMAARITPEGLLPGERIAGLKRRSKVDPLDDPEASEFLEE